MNRKACHSLHSVRILLMGQCAQNLHSDLVASVTMSHGAKRIVNFAPQSSLIWYWMILWYILSAATCYSPLSLTPTTYDCLLWTWLKHLKTTSTTQRQKREALARDFNPNRWRAFDVLISSDQCNILTSVYTSYLAHVRCSSPFLACGKWLIGGWVLRHFDGQ